MTSLHRQLPLVVNKNDQEVADHVKQIKSSNLDAGTQEFATGCIELALWLPEALKEKSVSIRQLQRLIFGNSSSGKQKRKKRNTKEKKNHENTANEASETAAEKTAAEPPSAEPENHSVETNHPTETTQNSHNHAMPANDKLAELTEAEKKKPGHGRLSHEAYTDAKDIWIHHDSQKPGDACPSQCGGKLYRFKPGIIVRISGGSLANVHKYHLEKLRCGLCGLILQAPLPEAIPPEKYDARFKALMVMQKYYVGVPFHRQASYQAHLDFPLAASVQYELCEQVADSCYPIIGVLEQQIANGELIQNDDTHVKILSLAADNAMNPAQERVGMFTSCIMGKVDTHPVALYYSGRQHAGENLTMILAKRDPNKPPIIQMCDALSANIPKSINTILCYCLCHGLRKFKELVEFYPEVCLHLLHELGQIFKHEATTATMGKMERFYFHRQHSKPIMLRLHRWLKRQLADRLVEPNSPLGKAIKYMLRHWKKLRRFLVVPGAPIDNNLVERALKLPIRVRKTANFYKTEHGALIASILTSLAHTAILSQVNPIDYFVALQNHRSQVFQNPAAWLPWNYQQTLGLSLSLKAAA